jgi:transcriptional regulator with GAF, ATPase, and Fis domain
MSYETAREADVAETFADMARTMQGAETRQETWQQLVDLAGDLLPEFEHAAISLVRQGGRIETVASSDEVGTTVDELQYETREGPCLSAIRERDMYLTGDLAAERRWPAFSQRAVAETGVRSMLCFRLFVQEDALGALNLYNQDNDAFDERAQAFGAVLAAHGAIAMSAADEHEHAEHLEKALESSREIGVAVGIVMAQSRTDRAGAFQILSVASQRMNVKLRDIAARIVEGTERSREEGGRGTRTTAGPR